MCMLTSLLVDQFERLTNISKFDFSKKLKRTNILPKCCRVLSILWL